MRVSIWASDDSVDWRSKTVRDTGGTRGLQDSQRYLYRTLRSSTWLDGAVAELHAPASRIATARPEGTTRTKLTSRLYEPQLGVSDRNARRLRTVDSSWF